jgi:aminoglycoside phosphotransferase (APT) family kinase protein
MAEPTDASLLAGDDPARVEGLIDPERLGAWMDAEGLPGEGLPVEYAFISGGSQNEIFEIRRGPLHCALRRPPKHPPPGRDEGILREWRIIEALGGTDVPHTEAIAVCTDHSVLGCTFYLMGFVDGWSPMNLADRRWPEPFDTDLEARKGLAYQLVDGIARLSKVDWRAKGLEDLGRPEGYHERQVERWMRFLERVKTREIPGLDVATRWLSEHKPLDYVPGIMHGDYQFANVMFAHGAPARLAAIVDWEMGTIGDPKIDLAWVVQGWPQDTSDAAASSYVDLTGMPGRSELIDYYARASGRQCDDMDYYVVLARWKLAIVLEQGYARAVQGEGDNPKLAAFGPIVLDLMAAAAELAETTDYRG